MKIAQRFISILAAATALSLAACAPTAHRQGTGEYIDDAVITSKVKAAFAADPTVKATEVKVDTFKVYRAAERLGRIARKRPESSAAGARGQGGTGGAQQHGAQVGSGRGDAAPVALL